MVEMNGTDQVIGGEGMKGFYDKIIPEFMNKYTKKWGGKVGEKELTINNDSKLNNQYKEPRIVEKGNKFVIEAMSPNGEYNLVIKTFLTRAKAEKYFKEKRQDYINSIFTEHSEFKEIEWISGAALIMKTIVFNNINGFDEDYFLFYEDADLCKRLKLKGFKIYFFPFSEIIHFKGENVNPDFINETYFYAKKSQLIYYKKHNNFFNRIMLRVYLFVKFGIASLMFRKQINFRIFKMICGIEND